MIAPEALVDVPQRAEPSTLAPMQLARGEVVQEYALGHVRILGVAGRAPEVEVEDHPPARLAGLVVKIALGRRRGEIQHLPDPARHEHPLSGRLPALDGPVQVAAFAGGVIDIEVGIEDHADRRAVHALFHVEDQQLVALGQLDCEVPERLVARGLRQAQEMWDRHQVVVVAREVAVREHVAADLLGGIERAAVVGGLVV